MTPARHDLLHLSAAGWAAATGRDCGRGLAHWAAHAYPVMHRRAQPGDRAPLVPVAVAFPAAFERARLAFGVAAADIAAIAPPPTLREAAASLPDRFRRRAQAVLALAAATGLAPRVFGSAMWQHVTGLAYLHARSDLDLLWDIPDGSDAAPRIAQLVSGLRVLEAQGGPRLDGEIVLDRARAANWRELGPEGAAEVLVKTGAAVMLMSRPAFLRGGAPPC